MGFSPTMFLLQWWPLTLLALAGLGYLAAGIGRAWWRWVAVTLLVFSSVVGLLTEGVATGCATRGGEQCMWFGFGMTLAGLLFVPVSALVVLAGYLFGRLRLRA